MGRSCVELHHGNALGTLSLLSFAVIEYGTGDWVKIRPWFSPMFHSAIGHFRVPPGFCFKTRIGAQPSIWKWFFHSHSNKTHFHKKGCAPSLILKVRFLELGSGLLDATPTQSLAQPQWQTGHFRVALSLCFKAKLSAKPLILKWFFYILMQIKLIFRRKVFHLASLWKREFLELGNGQLSIQIFFGPCLWHDDHVHRVRWSRKHGSLNQTNLYSELYFEWICTARN